MTMGVMSPFEMEVVEKLLENLLETESEDNINLARKLSPTPPKKDVVVALVEYYLDIGYSENASYRLRKLEVPFLVSSYNLMHPFNCKPMTVDDIKPTSNLKQRYITTTDC